MILLWLMILLLINWRVIFLLVAAGLILVEYNVYHTYNWIFLLITTTEYELESGYLTDIHSIDKRWFPAKSPVKTVIKIKVLNPVRFNARN
jgi:hypothetical protein